MPSTETLAEARRTMEICNACRYCEGYCAVFPAMELRRVFTDGDLGYLANLCHGCKGCYYACQYAPPHAFGLNVPKIFAELRTETYEDHAWPRPLARLFQRNGLVTVLITALALAAAMDNRGQVHAYDANRDRLAPIFARLKRAGTRNVQVHEPDADLGALHGKMDRVVVDAPCSGSGSWRRRPDTKWRIEPSNLETRLAEQGEALSQAAGFVRPGGFLIYITCSVLPEENENQVYGFAEDHAGFELVSAGEVWQDLFGFDKPQPWSADMKSITLTPASTDTDGFYFAVMQRKT